MLLARRNVLAFALRINHRRYQSRDIQNQRALQDSIERPRDEEAPGSRYVGYEVVRIVVPKKAYMVSVQVRFAENIDRTGRRQDHQPEQERTGLSQDHEQAAHHERVNHSADNESPHRRVSNDFKDVSLYVEKRHAKRRAHRPRQQETHARRRAIDWIDGGVTANVENRDHRFALRVRGSA